MSPHPASPAPIFNVTRTAIKVVEAIHFSGGLRAHRVEGGWAIGPLRSDDGLGVSTTVSDGDLGPFANEAELALFGVDELHTGDPILRQSVWTPLFGPPRLAYPPADTWGMIAHAARENGDEANAALAKNISISLRASDLQVRNVSNEYARQLLAGLRRSQKVGRRFKNIALTDLHLACHSLLSEMGSARDYLAQFAARGVGAPMNVDALSRLQGWLEKPANQQNASDPVVRALLQAVDPLAEPWLTEMGEYRNKFLHRQPLAADADANSLILVERPTSLGAIHSVELRLKRHNRSEMCDALVLFADMHMRLSRLASFIAGHAKYPPAPPSFVVMR